MNNDGSSQSVIDSQVQIVGTVKTAGSLRLDGKLEGDLHCGGDATIGKSAQIRGNLTVTSVSIAGTINGNIVAKDRIEMKSTARVTGDIKAKRLAVEDGVTFVGKSEVNPSNAPSGMEGAGTADEKRAGGQPEASKTPESKGGLFNKKV